MIQQSNLSEDDKICVCVYIYIYIYIYICRQIWFKTTKLVFFSLAFLLVSLYQDPIDRICPKSYSHLFLVISIILKKIIQKIFL